MKSDQRLTDKMAVENKNNLPDLPYSRALGFSLLTAANILGISSLLVWMVFVFHGGFNFISSRGISETRILIFDAFLSMIFFIQHSTMPRQFFQKWMSKHVHKDLHGAIFTICTGIPLLLVSIFWLKSDHVMIPIQGVLRYVMHFIFFLGGACFFWGVKSLGTFDIFGIDAIPKRLKGAQLPPDIPFTIRGPYHIVRHPLYLGTLLMIWSCPNLTSDRLMYNILWTVWIIVATMLEEINLRIAFGDEYAKYQKEVPMLIPWRVSLYKRIYG